MSKASVPPSTPVNFDMGEAERVVVIVPCESPVPMPAPEERRPAVPAMPEPVREPVAVPA